MEFLIALATLIAIAHASNGFTHCTYNGKDYANGEIWVAEYDETKFKVKCNIQGNFYTIDPVGCITPEGNELALDEAKIFGDYIWRCSRLGKYMAKLESFLQAEASCGDGHTYGSEWEDPDGFMWICARMGQKELKGCKVDGVFHPKDEPFQIESYTFVCRLNSDDKATRDLVTS